MQQDEPPEELKKAIADLDAKGEATEREIRRSKRIERIWLFYFIVVTLLAVVGFGCILTRFTGAELW